MWIVWAQGQGPRAQPWELAVSGGSPGQTLIYRGFFL